jgi:hypothetical protein
MTAQQLAAAPHKRHAGRKATSHILVGGLCGLAWAAGLRGFMAQIARSASTVDWAGTFGWIQPRPRGIATLAMRRPLAPAPAAWGRPEILGACQPGTGLLLADW